MNAKRLLFLTIMALCATSAWAYNFSAVAPSGQTLYYNIVDGNAQVTYQINAWSSSYTNLTGDLVIPASVTYDNITYSVTSIGSNAFYYCTGLTSVTIPNSVTSIGGYAFSDCTGLTSVTIPNSVTSIGYYAFYGCTGLTTVTIPNSVTSIGDWAFSYCTGLTTVTIPNSVTSIGVDAFHNVRHIEYYGTATGSAWGAITMNGVTEGDFVYADETKQHLLAYSGSGGDVTIPSTVNVIGEWAFYGCTGLTSVTIPNSVTSIGSSAFSYCTGLTTVTIPDSVTSIGDEAFMDCTGLTSVTIPNSVTSIGDWAFYGCTGLTSVFFNADSCADFNSNYPFYSCPNITSFTFGNNVRVIPAYICYNKTGLTSITIPNSITSIGHGAFSGCTGLTSVTIPNSVTSIGMSAFAGCTGLTSVTIPNSVTSIDQITFYGCTGLTTVTIGNSVTSIGYQAFSGCTGLTSVTIPNSVTSIGSSAFNGCTGLTSVTIPNSVTSIGEYAFSDCTGLTSVTIPNSVTSIGWYAFNGCTGLTSVTIGNSVTSIGEYAFRGCTGLTTVFFNADSCVNSNYPFYSCPNITSFTFGNNVRVIPASICYNMTGLTSVIIPNSVTSIGYSAFRGCTGLTSVTIPNSVTSIGGYAFYGCTGLTSVTIGNSVTSIGQYTFRGCTGLTSVTIPNSVTSIGVAAFYGCSGLTTVTIGNAVTSIGDNAFQYCSGLDTVFMEPETVPSLGDHCFDNNTDNRVFIIPCASYDSYYNHADWYSYRESLNEHEIDLSIIVASNSPYYGSVNVVSQSGHNVYCDSTTIVYAEDDEHCVFDHWSNGNTANPDTLHLNGDSTVTAIFIPNRYTLSVLSNDGSVGSVSGSGSYNYMDTIEIIATATDHHHFVMWNDGNRDNPRQYVITGDATVIATFAIDTHTVSVATNDIARGMVESTGTEFVYGTPCTVTATAYTGYTFAGWSNGVTANPYTFAVLNDMELTALFVAEGEQTYTVTVVSDDPTMGTVSGGGQALDGGTVTIRAVGNPGYHFQRWNDNNTDSVRTVEVHGNVTYTAYFASNSTETIDDVNGSNIKVYAIDGRIVVEGRENRPVWVFDMYGRVVDNGRLPSGVYLVKVGTLPARKVVVIR